MAKFSADVGAAIEQLLQGFSLVGRAINFFITFVLAHVGLEVPDTAVNVGTIVCIVLVLYKYSSAVSKIVLYALIFILLSQSAGLLTSLPSLLGL